MTAPAPDPAARNEGERPIIAWNLCRNGEPPVDPAKPYMVTVGSPHTGKVWTTTGKCTGAPERFGAWVVHGDDEGWESPALHNCQVVAWSEMPRPYTGDKP